MARNGSGTYNRAVAPYVAGTTITAATVNSEMDDMAAALTQSLSRDGQSPPTANLPMGNFRITGLANATASTDAAPLGQVIAKAGDTMTGALGFAVGTAAAPGVFVAGDTNTGFFQEAAAPDTLSVSVGGVEVGRFGAGGFMRVAAGTAAAPAYSFSGDTDTGFYGSAAGEIGFTLNATEFLRLSSLALSYSSGSNNVSLSYDGAIEITKGGGGAYIDFKNAVGEDADARIFDIGNGIGFQTGGNGALATRMTIDSAGVVDVAGNLRFNSGYGSAALAYGVRAWVNFNGTGTVAIRASGGVTSITDNGTGDYTVNFNFTMPDANYCVVGVGASSGPDMLPLGIKGDVPPTTTNVRVWVKSVGVAAGAFDPLYASIAIIR